MITNRLCEMRHANDLSDEIVDTIMKTAFTTYESTMEV
jgi:hypothetical protein